MKNLLVRFSFALALLSAAPHVHAQAGDVTGGSMTISLSSEFSTALRAQGVAGASYTPSLYGTRIPFLAANSGVFDLVSGTGTFAVGGGIYFTSATMKIKILNLAFETIGPYPVITGSIYQNNHFLTRGTVFYITGPNPLQAPITPGPLLQSGILAVLSPSMAGMLANTFKVTLPANAVAANLTINIGIVPMVD